MKSTYRFVIVLAVLLCFAWCCVACAPVTSQPTQSTSESSAASTASSSGAGSESSSSEAGSESSSSAEADGQASQSTSSQSAEASSEPAAFENDPAYDDLRAEVEDALSEAVIDVGVAFVDLSDPDRIAGFSMNGDTPLVAASMIKLAVLAEFLDEVDSGEVSMEEPYTIQVEDIVGGTGSVQSAVGSTFTLGELAHLMICDSDNVAANVLINRMGMDAVNDQVEELGLENIHLVRLMMDEAAIAQHRENLMSAADTAVLLSLIYQGRLVSETASAFALETLEAQSDSVGLAQGLPESVVFAHKTGTLALVKNDGGIVEAEKPYVLVMFCSGAEDSTALELMGKVSALVYERFE